MDYSKLKFVTPSVDGKKFTKGKVYAFEWTENAGGYLINDEGNRVLAYIPQSSHLGEYPFIPCHEDGTPLTKELTPLEAEMLAMLETINEGINTMDFTQLEGLQSEIQDLIKKAKQ